MVDMVKVKEAFKRAGHVALTGTSEERSGRFLPVNKENTLREGVGNPLQAVKT